MYAMRAPAGPARASDLPEPRKRPVPIVPAIYRDVNTRIVLARRMRTAILRASLAGYREQRRALSHLHMALLQTTLNAVEIGRVEVVSGGETRSCR